jgi:probable F420-dependent oxidoreductase
VVEARPSMKVRVGYGLGTQGLAREGGFGDLIDNLERLGFDSLWLSERITSAAPDPTVGLAFAAGRTTRLKFGTSVMVLPGRNPVVLAKELATLDRLSGGRMLPAFGLGIVHPAEQQAFGVAREDRSAWFEEALPLLRRLWEEDLVDHEGPRFSYEGLTVLPKPLQKPMDVWLGGRAPGELRRVGRLGDGWLPSFCTPADVVAGRVVVEEAADKAERSIDAEHYGVLLPYSTGALPETIAAAVAARRPDVDPHDVIAAGIKDARQMLERFIDVGFSKFVLVPLVEPEAWGEELEAVAAEVLSLQT